MSVRSRIFARLRRFRAVWFCLGALSILAAAAELALAGMATPDRRPTPELHWVPPVLEAVVPSAWFVVVLWRTRRDDTTRWMREALASIALYLTLLLLAFGVTLTLVLGVGGMTLFGPTWIEESSARTADRVGYVYTKGLLCGYDVYERRTWTFTIARMDSVESMNCSRDRPPKLTWNGAARRFDLLLTNPEERLGKDSLGIPGFPFH